MITFAAVVLLGAGFVIPAMLYGWILDQDDDLVTFADIKAQPCPDADRLGALLMARAAVTL